MKDNKEYIGQETDKICKKCKNIVYNEIHKGIDYPYFCLNCDENKYKFEVLVKIEKEMKLLRVNGENPFKQTGTLKPFKLIPCFNEHCTSDKNYVVFITESETLHFLVEVQK
jgi:hypothetical protein